MKNRIVGFHNPADGTITIMHPTGIACHSDGTVTVPQSGFHPAHRTRGYEMPSGYRVIRLHGKQHYVHRLICEAFNSRPPTEKHEVDHIDRNPRNNAPSNLRWVLHVENMENRDITDAVIAKYGVRSTEQSAYNKARYAANPEKFRKINAESYQRDKEKRKERNRKWHAEHREESRAYHLKRMQDPEYVAQKRANAKANYEKKKAAGMIHVKIDGHWKWIMPEEYNANQG